MLVRDMDLGHFDALDVRRLEVVADGLTFWRGAQLDIDTTQRTCPELSGEGGRVRLVVLAAKEGGRRSTETAQFFPRWQTPVPSRNPLSSFLLCHFSTVAPHPTPGTGDMILTAQEVLRDDRCS